MPSLNIIGLASKLIRKIVELNEIREALRAIIKSGLICRWLVPVLTGQVTWERKTQVLERTEPEVGSVVYPARFLEGLGSFIAVNRGSRLVLNTSEIIVHSWGAHLTSLAIDIISVASLAM